MTYINTLMIQKVLAGPHWSRKLGARDLVALTPLIWEHVTPGGRFEIDMNARRPLDRLKWRLVTRLWGQPNRWSRAWLSLSQVRNRLRRGHRYWSIREIDHRLS
jgi:hypothetical protein